MGCKPIASNNGSSARFCCNALACGPGSGGASERGTPPSELDRYHVGVLEICPGVFWNVQVGAGPKASAWTEATLDFISSDVRGSTEEAGVVARRVLMCQNYTLQKSQRKELVVASSIIQSAFDKDLNQGSHGLMIYRNGFNHIWRRERK